MTKQDDKMTNEEIKADEIDQEVDETDQVDLEEGETQVSAEEAEEAVDPSEEANQKIEELEDQILRLQAEIANMKRINTRERQEAAKYRSQSLATALIDVVDNLERALDSEVSSEDALALKEGVQMVYGQFIDAFDKEKIQSLDPQGDAFDPNFHQAVSVVAVDEDHPENTVVQVLQKGYVLDDRVIRPAMVIVAQ